MKVLWPWGTSLAAKENPDLQPSTTILPGQGLTSITRAPTYVHTLECSTKLNTWKRIETLTLVLLIWDQHPPPQIRLPDTRACRYYRSTPVASEAIHLFGSDQKQPRMGEENLLYSAGVSHRCFIKYHVTGTPFLLTERFSNHNQFFLVLSSFYV